MRRALTRFFFLAWCGGSVGFPAHAADPAAPLAQSPAAALLARPVLLRGSLGNRRIEMRLHMKANPDEGIEGEYVYADRPGRILLAGESDNDVIALEESENGSDISGQWDGRIEGGVLRGTWQSADGAISQPFELTMMPTAVVAGAKHAGKRSGRVASRRVLSAQRTYPTQESQPAE